MPDAVDTMRIVVRGKNVEVTPALKAYAEKKASKLSKFFDTRGSVLTEVTLSSQREQQTAEFTLQVGGLLLRGVGKTSDMYASIDEAAEKVERQFNKFRGRIQARLQGAPKLAEMGPELPPGAGTGGAAAAEAGAATGLDVEREALPRVVRTKRFAIKPMSVEEAVMQMELLGHDFFVFTNAATEEVNVLYRRRDGDFGLIEPEAG